MVLFLTNPWFIFPLILFLALLWLFVSIKRLDRFSRADWGSPAVNRIAGFIRWFSCRYHRLDPTLSLPIPPQGPAIVAANHVSGLDPFLLIAASPRPLHFLIAREEYQRFGLNWLFRAGGCIPVERSGKPEHALRAAVRRLKAGDVIAVFPHGKIHLDTDPPRVLKRGVTSLSRLASCAIYPVRIDGVRGVGHTILSVLLRSRVRLNIGETIVATDDLSDADLLLQLKTFIETPTT